jgi:DNA-binding response OmpR family regulator
MRKKMICIVEDDPDISELMQIVVENEGCAVEIFSETERLFSSIKKLKPCLVIMDVFIGGVDGAHLAKKLKKEKSFRVPVILISAKTSLEDIATEAGADGFLAKPFDIKDLIRLVKKFT